MAPAVAGYHHFAPTVSDVEASAQWYERVFGMTRVPVAFPHHGGEKGGYAVVLTEPRSGIVLGLHHHDSNPGQLFDERRTGLDHMSFAVAGRADLDAWASWLDSLGGVMPSRVEATTERAVSARSPATAPPPSTLRGCAMC